jgi:hypothetical protein
LFLVTDNEKDPRVGAGEHGTAEHVQDADRPYEFADYEVRGGMGTDLPGRIPSEPGPPW